MRCLPGKPAPLPSPPRCPALARPGAFAPLYPPGARHSPLHSFYPAGPVPPGPPFRGLLSFGHLPSLPIRGVSASLPVVPGHYSLLFAFPPLPSSLRFSFRRFPYHPDFLSTHFPRFPCLFPFHFDPFPHPFPPLLLPSLFFRLFPLRLPPFPRFSPFQLSRPFRSRFFPFLFRDSFFTRFPSFARFLCLLAFLPGKYSLAFPCPFSLLPLSGFAHAAALTILTLPPFAFPL